MFVSTNVLATFVGLFACQGATLRTKLHLVRQLDHLFERIGLASHGLGQKVPHELVQRFAESPRMFAALFEKVLVDTQRKVLHRSILPQVLWAHAPWRLRLDLGGVTASGAFWTFRSSGLLRVNPPKLLLNRASVHALLWRSEPAQIPSPNTENWCIILIG